MPLPEGANATRVIYLDGFISQGWSNYLTCDRTGTGGWTKPDGLYVIVPSYDRLTDENFRINFLAHESRHYSDNRRFPNLASWELEYRAKLVELAYAVQTRDRVLSHFISNQGDDPADSHSYANKRVLAALRGRLQLPQDSALFSVPVETLQRAAIAELHADTLKRQTSKLPYDGLMTTSNYILDRDSYGGGEIAPAPFDLGAPVRIRYYVQNLGKIARVKGQIWVGDAMVNQWGYFFGDIGRGSQPAERLFSVGGGVIGISPDPAAKDRYVLRIVVPLKTDGGAPLIEVRNDPRAKETQP